MVEAAFEADEAKDIRDKADSMEANFRQVKNAEAECRPAKFGYLPKLPTVQKPVLMPMRSSNGLSNPLSSHSDWSSRMRRCMAIAMFTQALAASLPPRVG